MFNIVTGNRGTGRTLFALKLASYFTENVTKYQWNLISNIARDKIYGTEYPATYNLTTRLYTEQELISGAYLKQPTILIIDEWEAALSYYRQISLLYDRIREQLYTATKQKLPFILIGIVSHDRYIVPELQKYIDNEFKTIRTSTRKVTKYKLNTDIDSYNIHYKFYSSLDGFAGRTKLDPEIPFTTQHMPNCKECENYVQIASR